MTEKLHKILSDVDGESRIEKAIVLARRLQERGAELQTPQEKRQQIELDRMIHSAHDRATLTQLTDQAFRSHSPHRAVDQLVHILDVQGIPRFFTPLDRTLLKGFQSFGGYLPGVAVPMVKSNMRKETANVILPAEHDLLAEHLRARHETGLRMNVNYLGEALLGERDAVGRLEKYLEALQQPEIEVISVKISTIYSQINSLAFMHTVKVLADRLERLYRTAANFTYTRHDGTEVPKFIYLDMEEYRDLWITAEAFMCALDRPGLEEIRAGIALQAYIPDSYLVQKKIIAWAKGRVAKGGAPVTMRIVKGANLEMERVEASIAGWPQAPFRTKDETDRNYKLMLLQGMEGEAIQAVNLGVASHNLFDVALGLELANEWGLFDYIQFEMLEGMANHQRRALYELSENVLLYAPACRQEDFVTAIGYLIRRLDENTGPDNFLRHAFRIQTESEDWKRLEQVFRRSCDGFDQASVQPQRTQDRRKSARQPNAMNVQSFRNEPDTDFSLPQNVDWAESILAGWRDRAPTNVPLVIDGTELFSEQEQYFCDDPSRPGVHVALAALAVSADVERAVQCARDDDASWRKTAVSERAELLRKVAQEVRLARAALMGAALAECGKLLPESDPEVSEAVDFLEYYAIHAVAFSELPSVEARGRGVAVVVPPWNFPIAIPCGGIAAALAAGNTVIMKPSPDAMLVGYLLCECFWRAGVSRKVLQFLPTKGVEEAQQLVAHDDVDVVIFTGGTETAQTILEHKPDIEFFAETGGKNATIVTAMADREQAIKHILHSAFSHSGQKCSATSLLILEDEVYEDESFKTTLKDAVESLSVGSAWDLRNRMGPLIRRPGKKLDEALKELEQGESWLVMPRQLENNQCMYSPGIKWGVQPGSVTHTTEFFGPVLGVMRAKNLMEAIRLANETGYGLTSGIESLDDREQKFWQSRVHAGNLYINRPTTGAIVQRQPFGGMGKSAFGPGIKAGGPNYVAQFMAFDPVAKPMGSDHIEDDFLGEFRETLEELKRIGSSFPEDEVISAIAAIRSYVLQMEKEFGCTHDDQKLLGQDNFRRYLPVHDLRIRVCEGDSFFEIVARVCAARAAGCRITLSYAHEFQSPVIDLLHDATEPWGAEFEFVEESDEELLDVIRAGHAGRIRYAHRDHISNMILGAIPETGIYLAHAPVLAEGRIELLWYLREQSLCVDYHRYGNLGERGEEVRAQPPMESL